MDTWYITDHGGPTQRGKVHLLSTSGSLNKSNTDYYKISDSRWKNHQHLGGCAFDHRRDILWVALEPGTAGRASSVGLLALHDNGPSEHNAQKRLNDWGFFPLEDRGHSSWVGFNPINGHLYSTEFDVPDGQSQLKVDVHQVKGGSSKSSLFVKQFDDYIPLKYEDGAPFFGYRIQGGCISPHGHLYLVEDIERKNGEVRGGIHGFRLSDGRRFVYRHVTKPHVTQAGKTYGVRPAYEFQDICFYTRGDRTFLHLIVMIRRFARANKVTINHYNLQSTHTIIQA